MTLRLSQLIIFNVCAASLVVAGWKLGYVQMVFEGDASRLSYAISALFVATLVRMFWDVWRGRDLGYVEHVEVWAVTLGLIANCVGFILALKGFDAGSLSSPEGAQKAAGSLLGGMSVAFYGTITGAVTALWLHMARRIA